MNSTQPRKIVVIPPAMLTSGNRQHAHRASGEFW